jgi:hypothetical protein
MVCNVEEPNGGIFMNNAYILDIFLEITYLADAKFQANYTALS